MSAAKLHEGRADPAIEIVHELHRLVDSSFTAFCEFFADDDGLRYGGIETHGDLAASRRWETQQFQPSNVPWDPARVPRRERSQPVFVAPEDVHGTRVWREMYEPVGLEVARRILVYDAETFVGWIGVHRAVGAGAFSRIDVDRFDRAAGRLCNQVVARSRLMSDAPLSMCVLVSEGGRVEATCDEATAWLARWSDARDLLVEQVRAGVDHSFLFGMQVRVVRMVGDGGTRHLILLTRARPALLGALAELTPMQANVAELAVVGATAKEIADHLGSSTGTVRVHLRDIYRRLGVASRVELAARLGQVAR